MARRTEFSTLSVLAHFYYSLESFGHDRLNSASVFDLSQNLNERDEGSNVTFKQTFLPNEHLTCILSGVWDCFTHTPAEVIVAVDSGNT